jgi:hypothetical protein
MTTRLCVHNLPNRSKSSRLGPVVRFTPKAGGRWGEPRGFDHGLEIHPGFNQKLSLAKVNDFHRLKLKTVRE